MALDGFTMYGITKELSDTLVGAKIDKISQAENDEILITTRGIHKTKKLLISASSSNPRIYLVEQYKKENPLKAPTFLMILRKYIQGGRITSITQEGLERIIRIDIDTLDDMKFPKVRSLMIEIMGRHSNIILVDQQSQKVLDSIKRIPITISSVREVLPGKEYHLPPSQGKLDPLAELCREDFILAIGNKHMPLYKAIYACYDGISPVIAKEICHRAGVDMDLMAEGMSASILEKIFSSFERMINQIRGQIFHPCIVVDKRLDKFIDFSLIRLTMYDFLTIESFDSISLACENFYGRRDSKERMSQRSAALKKLMGNKVERLENKLGKQMEELHDTNSMDEYRKKGDILTANMYQLKKGMDKVTVTDFYDENNPEITVDLDLNKTPSENIQSFYKKYNKLKNRQVELTKQTDEAKEELAYLQNVMLSIEEAGNSLELEEIRNELSTEGYLKIKGHTKKLKEKEISSPMSFTSSDGMDIFVGKNNKQNDRLTLKTSSPEDIWLHTKDIPGSHVIIKSTLEAVSDMTLVEAATLAAYYSKARMSSKVAVDYTSRKNVKKPSGAKPGMVIYDNYSTIYVNPEEDIIIQLKNNPK